MNSLPIVSLMFASALTGGVLVAVMGALRARAVQRRCDQENALTEAARLAWGAMSPAPAETQGTLSLSLSLGQEDPFGPSCPPFHSYTVKGGEPVATTA